MFVDQFRTWARTMGTRDARLYLSGYIGTLLVFVDESWPHSLPGLLAGDILRPPEQVLADVVPPGFVSRLPDLWPGPAPAPPGD